MNFTEEEKNKIFNNVRQIEGYIREFQAELHKPVDVYFNKYLNGGTSFDKLRLSKDFLYFDVEGKNRYFDINDTKSPRWYKSMRWICIYDDVLFALYLIVNWDFIKEQLLLNVDSQKKKQKIIDDAINNFVL